MSNNLSAYQFFNQKGNGRTDRRSLLLYPIPLLVTGDNNYKWVLSVAPPELSKDMLQGLSYMTYFITFIFVQDKV